MAPSTRDEFPLAGSTIYVLWNDSEDDAKDDFRWYRARVLTAHLATDTDRNIKAEGSLVYAGDGMYNVQFKRLGFVVHTYSQSDVDSTPCPWQFDRPDDLYDFDSPVSPRLALKLEGSEIDKDSNMLQTRFESIYVQKSASHIGFKGDPAFWLNTFRISWKPPQKLNKAYRDIPIAVDTELGSLCIDLSSVLISDE